MTRARALSILVVACCVNLLSHSASFAQPATPTSDSDPVKQIYRFDLAKILFASGDAEVQERSEVEALRARLEAISTAPLSSASVAEGFSVLDQMLREFRRHDLYLFLLYATNTDDEQALAAAEELGSGVRAARAAFSASIVAQDSELFEQAVVERPGLERYRYAVTSMRRQVEHQLGPDTMRAVEEFRGIVSAADYGAIVSSLEFERLPDGSGGTLDAFYDRGQIYALADPDLERAAETAVFGGFATQRDALALLFNALVRAENAQARARGFTEARTQRLEERFLPEGAVDLVLSELAAAADQYKVWQGMHPDALSSRSRWTVGDLQANLVASAAALGPVYQSEARALMDPESGRVDLASGPKRLPITGTASAYPIGTSIIFGREYSGSLLDAIIMAHEAGHAIQAQLMFRSDRPSERVPMIYSNGPGFFTESFGRFQEMLFLEQLAAKTQDVSLRAKILVALDARLLAVFAAAEEAAIEWRIHDEVSKGPLISADRLDEVTAQEGMRFTNSYEESPERRGLWMVAESYYQAPLHKMDDLYSSLLAARYYRAHQADPDGFATKYLALLQGGYDARPAELLRDRVGIDIEDPVFVRGVLSWLMDRVSSGND